MTRPHECVPVLGERVWVIRTGAVHPVLVTAVIPRVYLKNVGLHEPWWYEGTAVYGTGPWNGQQRFDEFPWWHTEEDALRVLAVIALSRAPG